MAKLVLVSGCCAVVNLISLILALSDVYQRNPLICFALDQMSFAPFCVMSLALCLVFVPPSSSKGSDSNDRSPTPAISLSNISTTQSFEDKEDSNSV